VVYLWGLRAGGIRAALAATLLFTTLPPILAHAGVMTTDFALCAMTSAAALASLHWGDLPNRGRSVLLGVTIALAFVSKFSALLYLPAA
jgi:4-amino-4-deoxy-L-arabinose transferase-like glycosyltransferase